ncbi:hypothetical protein CVT24_008523 [Panaeolus cyanescens]|uniref:HNH nuclease domain-containing protein n=1 Tax=Panaeolus cyanescens TaxID=181874 RepID=A0A409VKZ9_9AGAR|nr:hypothetical protein CVT24_008523 [Panaeolus cyanescens]
MMDTPDTPSGRIDQIAPDKLASRSLKVNARVKSTSPTEDRCIVENTPNSDGIELCHVFGRANSLNDDLMSSIEYHWLLDKNGLGLDTRRNCFFAGSHFHARYDNGKWCLMPDEETVEELFTATSISREDLRKKLDEYHEMDCFTYTFVAIHEQMASKAISWQKKDIVRSKRDLDVYVYPFDFPRTLQIRSHLYPEFVILSIGQHFKEKHITDLSLQKGHLRDYLGRFKSIKKLYQMWTTLLTPAEKLNHPIMQPVLIYESEEEEEEEPKVKKGKKDDDSYRGPKWTEEDKKTVVTRRTRQSTRTPTLLQGSDLKPPVLSSNSNDQKVEVPKEDEGDDAGEDSAGTDRGRIARVRPKPSKKKRKEPERSVSPSPPSRKRGPGKGSLKETDLMLTSTLECESDVEVAAPRKASKAKRKVAPLPTRRSTRATRSTSKTS